MSNELKLIESHTSFKGEQRSYRMYSDILQREIALEIYVPIAQIKGEHCIVVHYLPSLQTDSKLVASQSDYQRYTNRYDILLIIPDLFAAYIGTENERVLQYNAEKDKIEQFLTEEMPNVISANFNVYDIRSIMGYGFGGTVAMNLALKYRLFYRSVSALAPWLGFYDSEWFQSHFAQYNLDKSIDPLQWFVEHPNQQIAPLWIDQGASDQYIDNQIHLSKLETAVANHPQKEKDEIWINWHKRYDHSFYFVHSHIREHFVFHSEYHENI